MRCLSTQDNGHPFRRPPFHFPRSQAIGNESPPVIRPRLATQFESFLETCCKHPLRFQPHSKLRLLAITHTTQVLRVNDYGHLNELFGPHLGPCTYELGRNYVQLLICVVVR